MRAAELRDKVYGMLAESKAIKIVVGDEAFQFVLKKRTEQDFSDMVAVLDDIYNQAFAAYVDTPALRSASERTWATSSDDDLRNTVDKMLKAERQALGMDLFDDLKPEEDDENKTEDEIEEARNQKLQERLDEWATRQREELNAKSRAYLVDMLTKKDAEMHGRLEQVRARTDIIVSQCVYGDDNERIFATPEDVRKAPRNGLIDALRNEVASFLETETAQVIREVVQASDFCESTESESTSM